jgi:hypothetical protein
LCARRIIDLPVRVLSDGPLAPAIRRVHCLEEDAITLHGGQLGLLGGGGLGGREAAARCLSKCTGHHASHGCCGGGGGCGGATHCWLAADGPRWLSPGRPGVTGAGAVAAGAAAPSTSPGCGGGRCTPLSWLIISRRPPCGCGCGGLGLPPSTAGGGGRCRWAVSPAPGPLLPTPATRGRFRRAGELPAAPASLLRSPPAFIPRARALLAPCLCTSIG